MNKILILALSLSLSHKALGHGEVSTTQEDSNPLFTLVGQDSKSKEACTLSVLTAGFSGPEETPNQWYALVISSYSHDGDKADAIKVQMDSRKPGILSGLGSNGKDQIVIHLPPDSIDIRLATSFNIKWLHGHHFHTHRCQNLKPE